MADTNTKKEWLTIDDLQAEFSLSKPMQAKLRQEKRIPYSKVGTLVRYSRTKINQWLNNAEVVS